MVTSQSRSTPSFWNQIGADTRWNRLREGGAEECPNEKSIFTILKENGVRFPSQKADRLRKATRRDPEATASDVRERLRRSHDRFVSARSLTGRGRSPRRSFSRRNFVVDVESLQNRETYSPTFGVSFPTSRLPIDSRWDERVERWRSRDRHNRPREGNFALRVIEDDIARAAYDVGIPPALADGVIFRLGDARLGVTGAQSVKVDAHPLSGRRFRRAGCLMSPEIFSNRNDQQRAYQRRDATVFTCRGHDRRVNVRSTSPSSVVTQPRPPVRLRFAPTASSA